MTIRAEVQPDGTIEVMRPHRVKECNVFQRFDSLERALIVIEYWLKKDLLLTKKDRFVSQATRDARRAFKQLNERSPYHNVTKKT